MLLVAFVATLLFASPASAVGLGRLFGRRMLEGGDEGGDGWPMEATEPGAPPSFSTEGGSVPAENVDANRGEPSSSGVPKATEPMGPPAEQSQQQDNDRSTPPNASGSGSVDNGYAFLADAFNKGAIRIVPSRGGENPCHSNSPASTFFGQRYPGFFGGCLETQQNGR